MNLRPLSFRQGQSILESTARTNLWHGPIRSGKTVASILRWITYMSGRPTGNLMMIGKTLTTLQRNILMPMEDLLGARNVKHSVSKKEAVICGRTVMLEGANDEGAEGKIRGLTLAGAYGDEVTLWPESFWVTLMGRLSEPGAQFFGTTNTDSPFHWLKVRVIDRAGDLDFAHFPFALKDNLTLSPEYIASISAEYTGMFYKRFIQGLWVMAQGAIFDAWSDALEVDPADLDRLLWHDEYVTIDYGTTNPCVFLRCGVARGSTIEAAVLDEYYWDSAKEERQKTDQQYADDLVAFIGGRPVRGVIVDPSAASFIAELRGRGLPIMTADNAVLDGIRLTSSWMASGRLKVSKKCRDLIREIGSYVWDERAQLRGEDAPLKKNDHACDALRYFVMTVLKSIASQIITGGRRVSARSTIRTGRAR